MFVTGREVAKRIGLDLYGARVAVQGFGNVGAIAASLFQQGGATIVAVQDHDGTRFDPKGLDLSRVSGENGVRGGSGGELIDDEAFWAVDCDILLSAALEGQITAARANRITAKLVLEGANGPTLPDADDVLADRGILVPYVPHRFAPSCTSGP